MCQKEFAYLRTYGWFRFRHFRAIQIMALERTNSQQNFLGRTLQRIANQ